MQAACLLRKLCVVAALMPLAAHAGDVKISIRIPWIVPSILAALFPVQPLPPSAHHLSLPSVNQRTVHGGIAIDARTFVAGGIHYRLHGLPPSDPGTPDEARARSALQSVLDTGPLRIRVLNVENSGVRIVTLQRDG